MSKVLVNMFFFCISFWLLQIIVCGVVFADYLPINWNISRDRGNSLFEREYKYPMYQEVAPAPCDLTDSCDVFCRQDTDCNEAQKLSFLTPEPDTQCDGPLSVFDCGCDKYEKPEWWTMLCYVHRNPVYVGKFYKTPKKIEKFSTLNNLIAEKRRSLFIIQQKKGKVTSKMSPYGSPVMTFVPESDSFPSVSPLFIRASLKDNSYACKLAPVSYGFISSTVCLTRVTPELCQNSYVLSMLPFLVQGRNITTYSKVPVVLKDLNVLKGIKAEVIIKCLKPISKTKKFKNKEITYFQQGYTKPCDDLHDMHRTVFSHNICQNVLIYVQYEFTLNGSDIIKLNVEYGLTDVPIETDAKFSDIISKYIYLKQKFDVIFFDVTTKPSGRREYSRDDELLNRGYFVGEELNFGYKHTENSTTWDKGTLGVFKNGKSCDKFSPIEFGFDCFSGCHIGKKFSNCSQLRSTAENKFEALLKGDFLASYSNLRAPYNNSVPVLRSYLNFSHEGFKNSSNCYIPTTQDVLIQYTSIITETGNKIHRVLGIRIDRAFKNVSLYEDVSLTTRVFFFYVSSAKDKPKSRFWERMLSAELSENSWLQIFNAFDDVTPSEREEITFWCIFLIFLFSVAAACFKLDVNFDYFFS